MIIKRILKRPELRTYVGAALALVAAVPAVVVGVYLIVTSAREADQRLVHQMQGIAAAGGHAIEEHLYHHRHGLRLLVSNLAASELPLENRALNGVLARYLGAFDGFVSMHVADTDGILIAYRLERDNDSELAKKLIGHQVSDRDYFRHALAGQEFTSDAFLSRGTREQPIVAMSAPIIRDGKVVAVASGSLDLTQLHDRIRKLAPVGLDLILTDGKGRVLLATDATQPLSLAEALAAADLARGEFRYQAPDRNGHPQEHLVIRESVFGDWALYARAGPSLLLGPVADKLKFSLAVVAGAMLLAWLLSRGIASSVVRPVQQLIRYGNAFDPRKPGIAKRPQVCWFTPRELVELLDITVSRSVLLAGSMDDLKLVHDEERKLRERLEAEVRNRQAEIERQTETLKIAAQKAESASAAKSMFLANVSHEIRTPLASVIGFVDVARGSVAERPRDMLTTALYEARHLERLINDILDLSRMEEGRLDIEPAEVDLSSLLSEIANTESHMAREKGLSFTLLPSFPVPRYLNTDALRLRQILSNLIGNAIKFTQDGWVRLRVDWDGHGRICFAIEDTGIGITPEEQKKLFERFSQADDTVTRKFGGSGLGLWISRQLAELLGGEISLVSTPGRGSTFTLSLPAPSRQQVTDLITDECMLIRKADADDRQRIELLSGRVLLAEDNPNLQQLICHYLQTAGAEVVTADNGLEALERAASENFDLVLMDMHMPEMDGLTATRHLQERDPLLPIVALTADVMRDRVRVQREAGCVDTVAKPIDRVHLMRVVGRYLRRGKSQSAAGGDFMAELTESFRASLRGDYLTPLQEAIDREDRDAALRVLHQIHGVAGNFGYHELSRLGGLAEQRMRNGEDLDDIANLLEQIGVAVGLAAADA